ncbi:MAG: hypothetical protein LBU79_07300 [Planctomycetota bacterium]|jgi:hypothetical protein|nr:hypothetical protein [Planctomycetota bacterium]
MSIRRFLPLVLLATLLSPVAAADLQTVTDSKPVIPQGEIYDHSCFAGNVSQGGSSRVYPGGCNYQTVSQGNNRQSHCGG